jgi:hypothetical protein
VGDYKTQDELAATINQLTYEQDKSRADHMAKIAELERKLEIAREALEYYSRSGHPVDQIRADYALEALK